jgi:hypothetical protein
MQLILTRIEEEAVMTKPRSKRSLLNSINVASIVLAFVLSSGAQSIAGCGGYCEARQVRAICHRALGPRDLKAHQRDAEFEKCKANPLSYLGPSARGGEQLGSD